jgi:hypothetical protein
METFSSRRGSTLMSYFSDTLITIYLKTIRYWHSMRVLNDPNKSLVDLACGYMLMEKSSEEAIALFETLTENSQQFPSKRR